MLLDSASAEPVRFSTDTLPSDRRAVALGALHERGLLPIVPLPDRHARVVVAKWFAPGATLMFGTFDAVRQLGGRVPDDDVFFGINVGGTSHAVQGRRDVTIDAGAAIVIDPADGPFAVTRPEPTTLVGLRLDRALAATGDRGLRAVANPAVALLSGYLRTVAEGGLLADPSLAGPIVEHAATLVALAAGASSVDAPGVERGVRAARLLAIKTDIETNLTDPRLDVAALAAHQGVSPRYVHKLFEAEDTTCAGYVLRRRLLRAHRLLVDPRTARRTISAIAFDVGFGDLSSFNRAFRRAYGATPTDVRRLARAHRAASSSPSAAITTAS
jgi:AraC-like DNA-binding protein